MKPLKTTRQHLILLLVALGFVLAMHPPEAHAQIVGELQADIPFSFYAGNAKFPAGKYTIRMLDGSDLTVMEISSDNGSAAALFDVRDAEANSSPRKSELIFNKFGNRYFLAKLFDDGNPLGSALIESRYEKKLAQAVAEGQEHVPAQRLESAKRDVN